MDDCVRRSGWLPSGGGAGVYLSILARMPGVSRNAIDRAVVDGHPLADVRHARGSMVVPREEAYLALRLAQLSFAKYFAPQFSSGVLKPATLAAIGQSICGALEAGPQAGAELRKLVTHPQTASEDLFTAALAGLANQGIVRRFSSESRLDSPKYLFELVHPDDRPDFAAVADASALASRLAALFLSRAGPATTGDFAFWAGITKAEARKALAAIHAAPVTIPEWTSDAWLLPEDREMWESGNTARDPRVVLLPFRDPLVYARRTPAVLSDDPKAAVLDWKARRTRLGDIDGLHHHAIVAGGALVGVWEYDPETEEVVTRTWSKERGLAGRVRSAAADTARFIRSQLGDAKFYAADHVTTRAPRIAFCRGR